MKHNNWFKEIGTYLTVHFIGNIAAFAAILFLVPASFALKRNGLTVSDEQYNSFTYVSTGFLWKSIAEKKGK